MPERRELVSRAFVALNEGDVEPFRELLVAEADWVAIPQGDAAADTPRCIGRGAIVDRLMRAHRGGRRFSLGKVLEADDRLAAEVTVHSPEWSAPVTVYRVFTFRPNADVVVRLNDCIDESYALQVLVA